MIEDISVKETSALILLNRAEKEGPVVVNDGDPGLVQFKCSHNPIPKSQVINDDSKGLSYS